MAISWKLKTYLAKEHSIYTLVELQKKITQNTGVIISTQNLANIVNQRPKQIRLETMELICSSLGCYLSEILEIKPKQFNKTNEKQKLSYKNTPNCKRAVNTFPDPKDYLW